MTYKNVASEDFTTCIQIRAHQATTMLSSQLIAQALFIFTAFAAAVGTYQTNVQAPGMVVLSIPSSMPIADPSISQAPPHKDDEVLGGVALSSANVGFQNIFLCRRLLTTRFALL